VKSTSCFKIFKNPELEVVLILKIFKRLEPEFCDSKKFQKPRTRSFFLDLQKSESAEPEFINKIRDLHNTGSLFSLN
jgi:hypothetical protein